MVFSWLRSSKRSDSQENHETQNKQVGLNRLKKEQKLKKKKIKQFSTLTFLPLLDEITNTPNVMNSEIMDQLINKFYSEVVENNSPQMKIDNSEGTLLTTFFSKKFLNILETNPNLLLSDLKYFWNDNNDETILLKLLSNINYLLQDLKYLLILFQLSFYPSIIELYESLCKIKIGYQEIEPKQSKEKKPEKKHKNEKEKEMIINSNRDQEKGLTKKVLKLCNILSLLIEKTVNDRESITFFIKNNYISQLTELLFQTPTKPKNYLLGEWVHQNTQNLLTKMVRGKQRNQILSYFIDKEFYEKFIQELNNLINNYQFNLFCTCFSLLIDILNQNNEEGDKFRKKFNQIQGWESLDLLFYQILLLELKQVELLERYDGNEEKNYEKDTEEKDKEKEIEEKEIEEKEKEKNSEKEEENSEKEEQETQEKKKEKEKEKEKEKKKKRRR
ncbi:DNA-directed RNA polymerase i subunit rpa34 [Anaeramoeba flamelloides]|uniref:DNA-directed RNA polymerase i subunit rpa34 n=1 Tax=Anaeramoeba flamelloides TaxID=1746091 RepID=A0AAV7Z3N4_9EUKA|nr:DNA-directed RNA polymerase i subunit rpa34 [Anaeramoeba flamelloides]